MGDPWLANKQGACDDQYDETAPYRRRSQAALRRFRFAIAEAQRKEQRDHRLACCKSATAIVKVDDR
jgi:hypothetical protein